jgi:hypothetical protein
MNMQIKGINKFSDSGRIDSAIRRIKWLDSNNSWIKDIDRLELLRSMTGGRSDSKVLEAMIHRGNQKQPKIIKLGPIHELKGECEAYLKYIKHAAGRFFTSIEAATPGAKKLSKATTSDAGSGDIEAVVYSHAEHLMGESNPQTFEEIAKEALKNPPTLDTALKGLQTLFTGVQSDFYVIYEKNSKTVLQETYNLELGVDAQICVDAFDSQKHILYTKHGEKAKEIYPLDLSEASIRWNDSKILPGDYIRLRGFKAVWWGDRLMAEPDGYKLRIEVLGKDGSKIKNMAPNIKDGETIDISGQVHFIRAHSRRKELLTALPELEAKKGKWAGPGGMIPDPFVFLPDILQKEGNTQITSVIHGDLNPRNILMAGDNPCLIDYARTNKDQPLHMDFARLEGSLAREIMPADMSWEEWLRLERLLYAACRFGKNSEKIFIDLLENERQEITAAFRLFFSIRMAAYQAWPKLHKKNWFQDYMEHLFLFAHLSLKWETQETHKVRAVAAIAGVAVEAIYFPYQLWTKDALKSDGAAILAYLDYLPEHQHGQKEMLHELACLTHALNQFNIPDDDPLNKAIKNIRAKFVQKHYRDRAKAIQGDLEKDHQVFISLRAYIDLKGSLTGAMPRNRRSNLEMLKNDKLLAHREKTDSQKGDEDCIKLISSHKHLIMIGDAGAGKTTIAREWEYLLADAIIDVDKIEPRLPIVIRASKIAAYLADTKATKPDESEQTDPESAPESILKLIDCSKDEVLTGTVHLIVDALNELNDADKQAVADIIVAFSRAFPRTPILACHRQFNYVPGLLPFPLITLDKVNEKQARQYIKDYLRFNKVENHEALSDRLLKLLLDDPEQEQVRDLAQTPLFLWMIVEYYRENLRPPKGRGELFHDFSEWYLQERHHEEKGEEIKISEYEPKAVFLAVLGYELVQRKATEIEEKEIASLFDTDLGIDWKKAFDETLKAEMLSRNDKKVHFLHQCFQEYFAARHFLEHEAKNPETVRRKVSEFAWHDTFTVLLAFAGDAPDIISLIIKAALDVNPMLTARCLRMAERVDGSEVLFKLFVTDQKNILLDPRVGQWAHKKAAEALAEHGRGLARAALLDITQNCEAPDESRILAIERLAAMPGQARFEPVEKKIGGELQNSLESIFDQPDKTDQTGLTDESGSGKVIEAGIAAVAKVGLKELSYYLHEILKEGEWHLQRAAWKAIEKLGLSIPPKLRKSFVETCKNRLSQTEAELYEECVISRMDALNDERIEIMQHLADPQYLDILLKRRFAFGIEDRMKKIIDRLPDETPPKEAEAAWEILKNPGDDIESWLKNLSAKDDLSAFAAAHMLAASKADDEQIIRLFNEKMHPSRLMAAAGIVSKDSGEALADAIDALLRELMETVEGKEGEEACASLAKALTSIGEKRGNRTAAVVNMILINRRGGKTKSENFPWSKANSDIFLDTEDYEALILQAGDDLKTAVYRLQAYGSGIQHAANYDSFPNKLDEKAQKAFVAGAEAEQDSLWQCCYARAAVKTQSLDLLPWLLNLSKDKTLTESQYEIWNNQFGLIIERLIADIFRTIGYISRLCIDKDPKDEVAAKALPMLQEGLARLTSDDHPSIRNGICTGLGYLGEWRPILENLGAEEPWMHEAAENVFKHWLEKVPKRTLEREKAAIWIAGRLRDTPDLPPRVRSTLETIKERLEIEIGHHVG